MRPRAPKLSVAIGWTILFVGTGAAAGDDPPPSLEPPAGASTAPAPAPAPAPATPTAPARSNRPMQAIPGLTIAPARVTTRPPTTPASPTPPPFSLAPSADGGLPSLAPPATSARPRAATPEPSATTLAPLPSSRFGGRVIESVPSDGETMPPIDAPRLSPARTPAPRPASAGVPRVDSVDKLLDDLGAPGDSRPRDVDRITPRDKDVAKEKATPIDPPAARRPGLFGTRLPNPFAPRPPVAPRNLDPPSEIRAEGRNDPAVESAAKRRIERAAREAVGDRARSIDVRVVGKNVAITAHGVRLLQRRAVKRSLETMPGLSGYRSTVEILD